MRVVLGNGQVEVVVEHDFEIPERCVGDRELRGGKWGGEMGFVFVSGQEGRCYWDTHS